MSVVIFTKLVIVDPEKRLAKRVDFNEGLNVITTSQADGNDRGKSSIVRSLFHTLGAEGLYDTLFACETKVFILEFRVDGTPWTMLRYGSSFSLFDESHSLMWKCHHSTELAERLYETFGFKVMLPNRKDGELTLAPPAFSYLPNYIDQGGSKGSEFASFKNLGQYSNIKPDLFYTYAGAVDERYYRLTRRKEALSDEAKSLSQKLELSKAMIDRVDEQLGERVYSQTTEALDAELERFEKEYTRLSGNLSTLRDKLMELRRERSDRIRSIEGAEAFSKHWKRGYDRLRHYRKCPLCSSVLDDDLEVRISECETLEDVMFVKLAMESDLASIEANIKKLEDRYQAVLKELEPLRAELRSAKTERSGALAAEGLIEMRDSLVEERYACASAIQDNEDEQKEVARDLKDYAEHRKHADERLVELLKEGVTTLGLKGIDTSKIKGIRSVFKSNGSNQNLATLVWYLSIQRVQRELNPSRIRFPMVIDSPMSGEQDDEKKGMSYEYIISSLKDMEQVILSGLAVEVYANLPSDTNRIVLDNEKYQLLNSVDYESCRELFTTLLSTSDEGTE